LMRVALKYFEENYQWSVDARFEKETGQLFLSR
jgi:hypothetical protein